MSNKEQILQAITAIDAQREALGDVIVDTTINALQEMLDRSFASLSGKSSSQEAQRKQVTILFAKVTGFSGVSGAVEDTFLLNIINSLWQYLDNAITHQGGSIDKHIGDAVMGLFGVPIAHEDDPEQAIRAALRMRAALSDFVTELNNSGELANGDDGPDLNNLRLSVGINTGPVLLGRVGDTDEYTVIGDTVNVASRLERAAPPGGILISHDTYMLVKDTFNVEPLGPIPIKGRSEPIQVYLVLGVKPRLFYSTGRGVEGVETRMVGRDTELAGLKAALQLAINNQTGRSIMVVGDAGVGKSRLIHEFSTWVNALPQEVHVLKGRTYQHLQQIPYSLIRDLIATFFGIQDNDPASIAEEKLIHGVSQFIDESEEEIQRRSAIMAQLIGLDLGYVVQLDSAVEEGEEAPQLRDLASQYIADLFAGITAVAPAALIFLEDLHWADEGSLEILETLLSICNDMPLVIVMLSRPVENLPGAEQLLGRHTELLGQSRGAQVIQLRSLTEAHSRELVLQILRKVPEIPADLSDMIVSRAEGNPLYVEEMVKILIEDGVIIAGQEEWQVRRNQLPAVRVPPHINGVIQARLDRLSELERVTLQRAAVVGRVFWDSTVMEMNETAVNPLGPSETISALQALEKREMVFKRQVSGFAGSQAYVFKHAVLHQVSYESVLLRSRPIYHKQVGDWLAEQSGDRIGEYAGLIAEHYEQAGERTAAAELYETAAQRAQTAHDPELAIDYYRKALSLLLEQSHYAEWLLRLQEELGKLLRMRARFVESAQAFITMRFTAEEDGDLSAQARAWNGLATVQKAQGNFKSMLDSATQGEKVSWLVGAEVDLIQALLLQSEAHLLLGNIEDAFSTVERALQLSDRQEEIVARTQSLHLLCLTHIHDGRYEDAEKNLSQLQQQLSLLLTLDELHAAAVTQYALGSLYNKLGQFDKAANHLMEALSLYRNLDQKIEIGNALHQLGETARLRGNLNSAIPFFKKAISVASGVGYRFGALATQASLGGTLTGLENYSLGEQTLLDVTKVAENVSLMSGWRFLPEVYAFLAHVNLGYRDLDESLKMALKAHSLAKKQGTIEVVGMSWRVLGRVIAQLPADKRPLTIDDKKYDAAACYAESMRIFEEINGGGVASHREQAYTLWRWAMYETENGQSERGERLQKRAEALAEALGLVLV